jgi:ubiquinol-cytochrome c reductase cytochrome c subunit|tara:strand:- start:2093 stop:2503 length:411 start_codon:yes stop_codon:yes gene_type:complete
MNNLIIKITRAIKYTVCFSLLFTKALSEDSSEGEKLYLSHGCYSCHGYNGTGRYPLANDISGIMTSEELFTMFLRLRADLNPVSPSNSMPNYSKNVIDDSEAKQIYAYIKTFKDSPPQLEEIPIFKEMLDNSNRKE